MDGIESFNWADNMAKVGTGLKGGTYFKTLNTPQPMEIGAYGIPESSVEKMQGADVPKQTPSDPWVVRRNK